MSHLSFLQSLDTRQLSICLEADGMFRVFNPAKPASQVTWDGKPFHLEGYMLKAKTQRDSDGNLYGLVYAETGHPSLDNDWVVDPGQTICVYPRQAATQAA